MGILVGLQKEVQIKIQIERCACENKYKRKCYLKQKIVTSAVLKIYELTQKVFPGVTGVLTNK